MNFAPAATPLVLSLALFTASGSPPLVQAADDPRAISFNQALKLGDTVSAWSELPGTDGKRHSLADLKEVPVVVVVFTCNTCPTATDYEERILATIRHNDTAHPGKVRLVAINCNRILGDSLAAMTARAKDRKLTYAYLYDASQQIAKKYGAITTPQFFVLDAERKLVFTGGLDDATDPKLAKVNYLQAAIDATLAGQSPEVTNVPPRGCLIRFARERKTTFDGPEKINTGQRSGTLGHGPPQSPSPARTAP